MGLLCCSFLSQIEYKIDILNYNWKMLSKIFDTQYAYKVNKKATNNLAELNQSLKQTKVIQRNSQFQRQSFFKNNPKGLGLSKTQKQCFDIYSRRFRNRAASLQTAPPPVGH